MKTATLLFPISEDGTRVVLAMKKKGFGAGRYNGVGGKVEAGESVVAGAIREAEEEIGIRVDESAIMPRGEITFTFDTKPEWDIHVHIFVAREWDGEPRETDEMAPEWFPMDAIPFDKMWIDDIEWLPRVLGGEGVVGAFRFSGDGGAILDRTLDFQAGT